MIYIHCLLPCICDLHLRQWRVLVWTLHTLDGNADAALSNLHHVYSDDHAEASEKQIIAQ
jgi:hypothetical protein